MQLTKRLNINTGNSCNLSCKFCWYRGKKKPRNPSTNKIKKDLHKAKRYGIKVVEFTGGEPTIRKDIFELIAHSKKLGFKGIGLITNGMLLSDYNFSEKLIKAGLTEIKFSIHGSKDNIHDYLTETKGSLKNTLNGLKNIKKLGLTTKINVVVNKHNYKDLLSLTKLLIKYNIDTLNFLVFSPLLNVKKFRKQLIAPYSQIVPEIKNSIDFVKEKIRKINVRYVPFCLMEGYEKYLCNFYQIHYDKDEWDYYIKNKIEYGVLLTYINLLFSFILKPINIFKKDLKKVARELTINSKIIRMNTKPSVCKKCKYGLICEGVWKGYKSIYGLKELKPNLGKKDKKSSCFPRKQWWL